MASQDSQVRIQQVLHKLQLLPPERLSTVASMAAEASFNRVWDNIEGANCDNL